MSDDVREIKKDQGEPQEVSLNWDYFKGYVLDTKSILTSPLHWGKWDWVKASLVVGTTAGLYAYDQEIQDWVQRERNDTSDNIAEFAEPFGNGLYTLPPLAVFYLYGHFFKYEKAKRTTLLTFESIALSAGIFTQVIKFTAHRHRPKTGDPYDTWDGPSFSTSHLSFCSGHSSFAFALATTIASEYKNIVFIPPLAYGIATLTALSRVNDNYHWASDVFFGSALGYFTAKAVVRLHSSKKDIDLTIIPVTDGKDTALTVISYRF
ncbi:MAG: phosphatase PAP2 family protein [Deltaproteobacteria bacterium]|nr:MAG: phosphatase PAP2 family protein [Deltaproteobacteria bacterium]